MDISKYHFEDIHTYPLVFQKANLRRVYVRPERSDDDDNDDMIMMMG